jgi:hypothetical protein
MNFLSIREWTGASRYSLRILRAAIGILIGAIALLAYSNSLA